ncbi:MAG TPA: hypothetical protein VEB42_10330, partial [Chitinophagaceae bacterium]|nr:hypothetical protein [Chitinophagaceae bacterium]
PASATEAVTLTFNSNYTYTSVPPLVSSSSACNGTYRITNANTIMMTSSCLQDPAYEIETGFTISGNTLILDHRTTATGVKTKYIRQ